MTADTTIQELTGTYEERINASSPFADCYKAVTKWLRTKCRWVGTPYSHTKDGEGLPGRYWLAQCIEHGMLLGLDTPDAWTGALDDNYRNQLLLARDDPEHRAMHGWRQTTVRTRMEMFLGDWEIAQLDDEPDGEDERYGSADSWVV